MPGGRTVLVLIALLVGAPARAGDYHAPRNAFGQPDFEGLWSNGYLTQLERPDAFKTLVIPESEAKTYDAKHIGRPPDEEKDDKIGAFQSEWWELNMGLARIRGQARTSWIVSPADGQVPTKAATEARRKASREMRKTTFDNPEGRDLSERCLDVGSAGPPMLNFGYNDNYQIVQTKDAVALYNEYDHNVRIVRLGAKHPPGGYRRWMGDSVGHFEGDTLVIETTNFTRLENDSEDPSSDTTVTERITRISPTQLYYEFTVSQPSTLVQPYRGEMLFFPIKGPLYEFACHEGNYGLANILAGGREQERAKAAEAAKAP